MPITKITPYTVDSTQNFTFNNVTATGNLVSLNANLGNLATATSLTLGSGNLIANTGNVIFGNVGNVKITGGTANFVLSTDGTGNLNWVAQSGGGGGASNASVLGYSLIFGG